MRLLVTTATLCVFCLTTNASASFQFTMSGVTVNTSVAQSSLAIDASNVPTHPTIFSLTNVGDSVTMDIFNLSAQGTGTGQVAVDFQFSQPVLTQGGGGKGGGFVGMISNGSISWANPNTLNFGTNSDGVLEISLSNGPLSAPIQGTFTLKAQPGGGGVPPSQQNVPEPGSVAIWSLLGVVGMFVAFRKKR